jgi:amino acid adenylation domain-containing protein
MADHLRALLEGAIVNPEWRLSQLPVLTADEQHRVLVDWNSTAVAYPNGDRCLHEIIEEQTARTPERVALLFERYQLSYRELNNRANQLAWHLRNLGVGPDVLVGILADRSLEMVVALLGVLKAGGAYVPIDPDYPPDRVAFMLEDAGAPVLLTQARFSGRLPRHEGKTLYLDSDWDQISREDTSNPPNATTADSLAYMIYTSGSTGRPKGAMNTHRGICNRLLWMQDQYGLTEADTILQKTPFSFDVSVWEFLWPLLVGARLVLARPGGHREAAYLVELINEQRVTVLHFVPSMLGIFLEEPGVEGCQSLRHVICSGQALPFNLQEQFFKLLPAQLHNLYGPTEAAVDVTHWTCQRDSERKLVPIGRPVANTQIYILDRNMQPVPIGVPGELYIGGVQVGRGYHNRAELTAERFLPDPFSRKPEARIYKTGDLCRWLPDGAIEYLARMDFQVKIRGQRIELGEIEAVLGAHEAVKQCVVVVREKTLGDQTLVAYFEPRADSAPDASDLRNYLKKNLPDYMLPSAFVLMEKLPLTPNGKIDRKALPAPEGDAYAVRKYEAPQGEVETTLAGIWADVLKVERVGRHDHFFELGGHSLLAVKLIERMRRKGLHADVRALFSTPTLAELAAAVGCQGRLVEVPPNLIPLQCDAITPEMLPLVELSATEIERIVSSVPGGATNVQDIYPLAPLQEGILFHHLMAVEGDPYLLVMQYSFDSRARLDGYLGALQAVIDRHDILRTAVVWEGLREPVQVVWRRACMPVEEVQLDPAGGDVAVQLRGCFDPRRRRIDLRQAPMIHACITHDAVNERWLLLLLFHQIWSDRTSADAIDEEIQAHLLGQADRLPTPLPFRNFVAQARLGMSQEEHEGFFRQMLGDVDEPTAPFGLLDVQGDGTGIEEARLEVDAGLARRLRERARKLGVSAASLCHLAWAQVLARVSGREDVVFGTVLFGRMQGGEGADRVLGLFINTLPVRIRVGQEGVEASARAVHTQLADLLRHEHASLVLAQRCSAVPSPAPLFTALLNYRHSSSIAHAPSADAMLAWEGIQELYDNERTNYPFTLNLDDMGEGFRLTAQVQAPIEPLRVCDFMHTALASLVTALETAPGAAVRTLNVLPEVERQQVLYEWNQTKADYTRELSVHHLFESQVERSPDAPAVVFDGQTLTYRELNARANRLAHHLRKLGVGPGELAGICIERSLQMVVAVLAVLKAGGAYVPLDPAYPEGRIDDVLTDAGAIILLTEQSLLPALGELFTRVVCLDRDETTIDLESSDRCDGGASFDDLAYVIYTSGSTGKPKGVQIEHRAVVNFLSSMRHRPGIDSQDVMLAVTTLAFDIAGLEIFLPLLSGARVVISSRKTAVDGFDLIRTVERHGVSVMQATPATWRLMLEANWQGCPTLKVLCGGEPLSKDLARQLLPRCRELWNMYGPTETTIWSTCSKVMDADDIHIGRPIDNTDLYILDDQFQLLPIGVPGELFIGGDGLARGYLNRPELSEEKFISHPFKPGARLYRTGDLARYRVDGAIDCLGRLDFQVKIRGFRIELGEIEATLVQHPAVKTAVADVQEEQSGEKYIVAYVVGNSGPTPIADELRFFLKSELPDYMLPARFVFLESFPLNPNGKINRHALPVPARSELPSPRFLVRPTDAAETKLAEFFGDLLGVRPTDVNQSFFDLGGHSLLATKLVARINEVFGRRLVILDVFQAPTIAQLARILRQPSVPRDTSGVFPIQPNGSQPPLFLVRGGPLFLPLARRLGSDQPLLGLHLPPTDATHLPARVRFEDIAGALVAKMREVQPNGPYYIGGLCVNGVIAYEMANQLSTQGQQVGLLVLFDSQNPTLYHDFSEESRYQMLRRRLVYHAQKLVRLQRKDFWPYVREKLEGIPNRWKRMSWQLAYNLGRPNDESDLHDLDRLVHPAANNYRPQAYSGPVAFFQSSDWPVGLHWDFQLGWRGLVTGVFDVYKICGAHYSVFYESNVDALAAKLSFCLHEARQSDVGAQLAAV